MFGSKYDKIGEYYQLYDLIQIFCQVQVLCNKLLPKSSHFKFFKDSKFCVYNGTRSGLSDFYMLQVSDLKKVFKSLHEIKRDNIKINPKI